MGGGAGGAGGAVVPQFLPNFCKISSNFSISMPTAPSRSSQSPHFQIHSAVYVWWNSLDITCKNWWAIFTRWISFIVKIQQLIKQRVIKHCIVKNKRPINIWNRPCKCNWIPSPALFKLQTSENSQANIFWLKNKLGWRWTPFYSDYQMVHQLKSQTKLV